MNNQNTEVYDVKGFIEGDKKDKVLPKIQPKAKVNWKVKFWIAVVILVLFVTGVAYIAEKYVDWRAEHEWQVPIVWVGFIRKIEPARPLAEPVIQENTEAEQEPQEVSSAKPSWTGKVSYYSHGDGCIGCHPEEIMANGQKFNENAMTLAFNRLPLNTKVRVFNLDNGANTIATVTDTGGFEAYNRIADLSLGLMRELNAQTDVSNIKIEVL